MWCLYRHHYQYTLSNLFFFVRSMHTHRPEHSHAQTLTQKQFSFECNTIHFKSNLVTFNLSIVQWNHVLFCRMVCGVVDFCIYQTSFIRLWRISHFCVHWSEWMYLLVERLKHVISEHQMDLKTLICHWITYWHRSIFLFNVRVTVRWSCEKCFERSVSIQRKLTRFCEILFDFCFGYCDFQSIVLKFTQMIQVGAKWWNAIFLFSTTDFSFDTP